MFYNFLNLKFFRSIYEIHRKGRVILLTEKFEKPVWSKGYVIIVVVIYFCVFLFGHFIKNVQITKNSNE